MWCAAWYQTPSCPIRSQGSGEGRRKSSQRVLTRAAVFSSSCAEYFSTEVGVSTATETTTSPEDELVNHTAFGAAKAGSKTTWHMRFASLGRSAWLRSKIGFGIPSDCD